MDLDTMKTYIEDLLIERGELYKRIHKAEADVREITSQVMEVEAQRNKLEAEVARLERLVANG